MMKNVLCHCVRKWRVLANPVTFNVNFLTRPNVLIVLLKYIDLFNLSGIINQLFGRGYPAFYHSVLLYFISSIASYCN